MDPVIKLSKRISLILRHKPESIGATLNPQGWMPIQTLLDGVNITRAELDKVVKAEPVPRY